MEYATMLLIWGSLSGDPKSDMSTSVREGAAQVVSSNKKLDDNKEKR